MSIRSSVGSRGVNQTADVRLVQQLLNRQQVPAYTVGRIAVDGLVGPETIGAITRYQQTVVKLTRPDGRVDPGGRTMEALERHARRRPGEAPNPAPPPGAGLFTLTARHGGKRPTATGTGMYESTLTLAGPRAATFRGSIYPDEMSEWGWLKDGTYDLSLTFHRKERLPTLADLVVKTQDECRPALTVNGGNQVPVNSDDPSKRTAVGINVHNGFNSNRGSKGCVTIHPAEWSAFITIFLELYPKFSDWYEGNGSWRGKTIGKLVVGV